MSPEVYKGGNLKKYLLTGGLIITTPVAIIGLKKLYEVIEKKKADNIVKRRRRADAF